MEIDLLILSVIVLAAALIYWRYHRKQKVTDSFKIKDGWVYPQLSCLMEEKEMIALMREVEADSHRWLSKDGADSYTPWECMGDLEMIASVWDYTHLKLSQSNGDGYDERVRLSAAAFIHGFRIPQALWIYNRDVLVQIARYELVRGLYWVQGGVQKLSPYVRVVDLAQSVQRLRSDEAFMHDISACQGRPSSFNTLWLKYGENLDYVDLFCGDRRALKKALTVFYAVCGLHMPRDYLYYDEEVDRMVVAYLKSLSN